MPQNDVSLVGAHTVSDTTITEYDRCRISMKDVATHECADPTLAAHSHRNIKEGTPAHTVFHLKLGEVEVNIG